MKVPPPRADRFVQRPDDAMRAVLVYGPDRGLVRERADALVRAVAGDPQDPFRTATVTPDDLKATPSLVADEAAALAFGGGRRAIRLSPAGDDQAAALERFLADPVGDGLVVAEAGDLPPRSRLRALFEAAANAAAVACYRDDGRALAALIDAVLAADGLSIGREARAYLAEVLGDDRATTRRELEKLALFMGPGSGRTVELADAVACIGDNAALGLEDVTMAAGDGDLAGVDRALERALAGGATPVGVLQATARHFQRLHLAQGLVRSGATLDQALGRLRPPVFWKVKDRFGAQVSDWTPEALSTAVQRLTAATVDCMRTGAPADAIAQRALFQIAGLAAGRGRGVRRSAEPAG